MICAPLPGKHSRETHTNMDMCFLGSGTQSPGICVSWLGEHITLGICVSCLGEHISPGICVSWEWKHISLGIFVSWIGEHISPGICVSRVGEHISLGICVSWVGQRIPLGICVSWKGEHITRDMCFPGRGTHILGDPGADSGGEGKSKGEEKYGRKKSKERREEPLGTMSYETSSKWSLPFSLLIGVRKLVFFRHQSEGRTAATVWNWSGKTLSLGALLAVLYFSSCHIFPPV